MATRSNSFCLPLVLRRCLVDGLEGTVALTTDDPVPVATIHVQAGNVLFVTSQQRAPRPAERPDAYISERVCALANLVDAEARFERDEASFPHQVPVPIPRLVFEAVRGVSDARRVAEWAGDPDEPLALNLDALQNLPGVSVGPAEGLFLSRIDRPMTTSAMLDEGGIDRDLALRLVCALRFLGCLTPVGPGRPWIGDTDPFGRARPAATPGVDASVDMGDIARVCYLVEEKLHDVEAGADFYALLEVERRAPADRIKATYRELAKTFHPDRHAQLAAFDADVKLRLEKIFSALTAAYATLSNPKEREAYDAKLSKGRVRPVVAPPAPAPPQKPETRRPVAAPPRETPAPAAPEARRAPIPRPVVPPLPKAPNPKPKPEQAPAPPTARAPQPALNADQLFEHGVAYAEAGDFERASRAFQRAIEVEPKDARSHVALGAALANIHGLDKAAEAALRRAAELDPNSAAVFVELALVYRKFGREGEARTLMKRAALLDPTNEDAARELNADRPAAGDAAGGFFKRLFRSK
jgi:curved DNA-binding protein CbpA